MTVVKVVVFKPSKGSKLGISLARKDDSSPLTISGIPDDGLFSKTPLVPGLVVLKIDDQEVTWMSPKEACDILRSVNKGDVSVTAEGFVGKIVRKRTYENIGIVLEKNKKSNDDIFIARIKEESNFFNTDIKTGMKIISINNSPCPASAVKAIRIMRNTIGKLKIVAVNVNRERPAPSARVPENAQPEANKELEGSWLEIENDAMRRKIEELEAQIEGEKEIRDRGEEMTLQKIARGEPLHLHHADQQGLPPVGTSSSCECTEETPTGKGPIHEDHDIVLDSIEVRPASALHDQRRKRSRNRLSLLNNFRRRKSAPRVDIIMNKNEQTLPGSDAYASNIDQVDPRRYGADSDSDTPEQTIVHKRTCLPDAEAENGDNTILAVKNLSDDITLSDESEANSDQPLENLQYLAGWAVFSETSRLHGEDIPIPPDLDGVLEQPQDIETQKSTSLPEHIILHAESKTIDVDCESFSLGDQVTWDVTEAYKEDGNMETRDEIHPESAAGVNRAMQDAMESEAENDTFERYLESIGLAGPSPWDAPEAVDEKGTYWGSTEINSPVERILETTELAGRSPWDTRATGYENVRIKPEEDSFAPVQRYLERIGLGDSPASNPHAESCNDVNRAIQDALESEAENDTAEIYLESIGLAGPSPWDASEAVDEKVTYWGSTDTNTSTERRLETTELAGSPWDNRATGYENGRIEPEEDAWDAWEAVDERGTNWGSTDINAPVERRLETTELVGRSPWDTRATGLKNVGIEPEADAWDASEAVDENGIYWGTTGTNAPVERILEFTELAGRSPWDTRATEHENVGIEPEAEVWDASVAVDEDGFCWGSTNTNAPVECFFETTELAGRSPWDTRATGCENVRIEPEEDASAPAQRYLEQRMETNLQRQPKVEQDHGTGSAETNSTESMVGHIQKNLQEAQKNLRREWAGTATTASSAWASFTRMF
jgi:hypothetical protein